MSKKGKKYFNNSVVNPIHTSATYYFEDTKQVVRYHNKKEKVGRYGRYDNPNWLEVEEKLAKLDLCESALIFPSGMSAIATTLMSLSEKGKRIIYTGKGYRNIRNLCGNILTKFGVDAISLSPANSEKFMADFKKYYNDNTSVVFLEIPSNPHLHLVDLEKIKKIINKNTLLIVDSTFSSPINFQPVEWGADIVIHSCGKYIGGHADLMAGSVAGKKEIIEKIRNYRNVMGSIAESHSAYLLNRSIATLKMRIEYLNQSGLKLANFLENHPKVKKVFYSGLPSYFNRDLAEKYLKGHGGVVTFELDLSKEKTAKFVDSLKIPYMGTNFGSCHSMVEQCSIFTYYNETKKVRDDLGISDTLIRYSIGFENVEDIINDISKVLEKI
ncbi:MAG: aminotransferase class I/II-fold pyridoxal phosphate-dependent enzyme [Parcubacteria group bacterium]|jgi:cystathionine gamma-synthase